MQYLFSKSEAHGDGSVTIPASLALRWFRQASTPYTELSEQEKQSDREEVAHILPIIDGYAGIDPDTAITAFMGWLTSRDEVVGPFSSRHEASEAAQLLKKFCEAQGWHAGNERFHRQINLLRERYPE
jgi:hypothetical protein